MATSKKSTAAVLDETIDTEVEAEVTEPTLKQIINEGIARVIEATGVDVQKNRYKAMRAIAFQAFADAIEAGTFDELVDDAIANVDTLPSGWEIERTEKDEPVKPTPAKTKAVAAKPATKAAATKAPAKAKAAPAAKPAARKRPAR